MNEAAQIASYKAVRERLYGKPRVVNLAVDEKRAVEQYRAEQRRKFEEHMAAVAAGEREAEIKRQRYAGFLSACASGFGTKGIATGRLSLERPVHESVNLVGVHRLSMKQIALRVLLSHPGIKLEDVKGVCREKKIMLARRHVVAAIRSLRPDISYPEIGRFVNKDHSSCVHAVQQFFKSKGWSVSDFNTMWTTGGY